MAPRAASAAASRPLTTSNTRAAASKARSAPFMGLRGALVMEAVEQLALSSLHAGGLLGPGVIVAEHVEDAVHDEQRHLVVVAAGVVRGLALGDGRAQDDVAQQQRHLVVLGVGAVGAGGPGIGPAGEWARLAAGK